MLSKSLRRAGGALALALAVFAIGATHIFLSGLQVEHYAEVWGPPKAEPGQPTHFRFWARSNNPPGLLKGAAVRLTFGDAEDLLHLDQGTQTWAPIGIQAAAQSEASESSAESLTLAFDLHVGQDAESVGRLALDLGVAEPPRVPNSDTMKVTSVSESTVDIDIRAQSGRAILGVPTPILVRVAQPNGTPISTDITCSLEFGTVYGPKQRDLRTNRLGIATFVVTADSETDWSCRTTDAAGNEVVARKVIGVDVTGIRLGLASRVVTSASPPRVTVSTNRTDGTVFLQAQSKDTIFTEKAARLRPGDILFPLPPSLVSKPRVVWVRGCFSPTVCKGASDMLGVLATTESETAKSLLYFRRGLGLSDAWSDHVAQLGSVSREEMDLAMAYMSARATREPIELKKLGSTEDTSRAALDEVAKRLRWWADVLFFIVGFFGFAWLTIVIIRERKERALAMSELMLEDDEADQDLGGMTADLEQSLDEAADRMAARARSDSWLFWAESISLVGVIVAFALGIWLLFQAL